MGLFNKKLETDKVDAATHKKVDAATGDLAAARAKLAAIDAGEAAALVDSKAFALWSTERSAAVLEVERHQRRIEAITEEGAAQKRSDADAVLQRLVDACEKNNAAVAERYRTEYPKLSSATKALARDMAKSTVETDTINKLLPDGAKRISDANFLVRSRPAILRENISEKPLKLWVRATDGGLIGDQDAVVEAAGGVGHYIVNNSRVDCLKRGFISIQYHPEVWAEHPEHFHSLLRLPNFDRPSVDFDGAFMVEHAVAELSLVPPKDEKRWRRPVQTELIPAAPWTPPVLKPVGAIDDAE